MKKILSLFVAVLFAGSMMAGDALIATFDFTTNEWGLPEGSANGKTESLQFNNGTYTITLEAADKYYFNVEGYLMLGKKGSSLTLPAFEWNTSKIVVTGREAASAQTKQNIFVGDAAVSAETTGVKVANVYEIAAEYQAAGNVYVLKILSAHNSQITKIEIYTPCDTCAEPVIPVDSTEIYAIDFTKGQGDWTINDVEKDTLNSIWMQDSQYGMKAFAYTTVAHASESWLISPAIDLSNVEEATLSFAHARKFGQLSHLSVKAKAAEGEWADLSVSAWPDGSSWNYIDATADLADVVGLSGVQIAFVYTSTASEAATWEIKTVSVNKGHVTPPTPEKIDTISVAQAVAIAEALAEPAENGKSTTDTKEYVVGGYSVTEWAKNADGTWSFGMCDEKGGYYEFQASNCTTDSDVAKDDYMYVRGRIAKRKTSAGKIQLQIYKGTGVHGQAPQGIENITLTEKAQKVMIDGVMYIVRDNKMFNLQGVQVR